MKYIIIGNSAAGLSAAKEIRNNDKTSEVIIIGRENHPAYGRPMISYYLKDKVSLDKLPIHNESFYKDNKIDIIYAEAMNINPDKQTVELSDSRELSYDKLILATGSVPFIPPISGMANQSNIYTFLDIASAIKLKQEVKYNSRVVILGGGLIALKAAEGLKGITNDISVIEWADRILPTILDNRASDVVRKHIEANGIKFFLNNSIVNVIGEEKVSEVVLKDGVKLEADILVIAVGVRPEVKLAKDAGITVGRGIIVDNKMTTSDKNIFAAGDCVEVKDVLDNKSKIIALWPNAVAGGRAAGSNASGVEMIYDGTFPYNAIDFFGLRMITGGIINPDNTFELKVIEGKDAFSSFVIKDDRLYGYMLIGNVDRAGIFTDIIRNGYKLSEMKDVLSTRNFLSYEQQLRRAKYKGQV